MRILVPRVVPLVFLPGLLVLAILLGACGCGGRGVEQVQVTGRVTFDGQPMPGLGDLYFTPISTAADQPQRPGFASFGPDGLYSAGTFASGDGLFPGTYHVMVHCWKVAPDEDGKPGQSHIPQRYNSPATSGLELIVPSGSNSLTWDVKLQSSDGSEDAPATG